MFLVKDTVLFYYRMKHLILGHSSQYGIVKTQVSKNGV